MRYAITKLVLFSKQFVDISESDYQHIKVARYKLIEALNIEEKWELVVENYREFEMEILKSSTSYMLFSYYEYSPLVNELNKINRRLINLLTACRLYVDQIIHQISNIYGISSLQGELIRKQMVDEYESEISYRFMEALRNHVQHRGFPIHRIIFNSKRLEDIDGGRGGLLYSLTPGIELSKLDSDEKFKKSVLNEIKEIENEIDIKLFLRTYIQSLGKVHEKVREVLQKDIPIWEKTIFDAIERFENQFPDGQKILGLAVAAFDERNNMIESVEIFTEFLDHRRQLERKNQSFAHLASKFVTSQIIK
jgi:hypothetical protein